jgi:hypothetical protein
LTPKIGPVHLVQNHLQSSRKIIFQYSEHPKIKFYNFFTYTNQKKSAMISFSMFSTRSKMKNRVKIVDFFYVIGNNSIQKEKSRKKFLHGKKDCEMIIGYTFRVGYIYRAGCTCSDFTNLIILCTLIIVPFIYCIS